LAEYTTEVTVGKKDGTGSVLPHQRNLFAEVRLSHINNNSGRSATQSKLAVLPIGPALPRTQLAVLEDRVGLLNSLGQPALLLQLAVGGIPLLSFLVLSVKRRTWKK
jgi:hypothetical protein